MIYNFITNNNVKWHLDETSACLLWEPASLVNRNLSALTNHKSLVGINSWSREILSGKGKIKDIERKMRTSWHLPDFLGSWEMFLCKDKGSSYPIFISTSDFVVWFLRYCHLIYHLLIPRGDDLQLVYLQISIYKVVIRLGATMILILSGFRPVLGDGRRPPI